MKKKELENLRKKTGKELETVISEKKTELVNMRLEHKIGKLKNMRLMKALRRDIAQALTILNEKKLQDTETILEKPDEASDATK